MAVLLFKGSDDGHHRFDKARAVWTLDAKAPFTPEHPWANRAFGHMIGRFDSLMTHERPQGLPQLEDFPTRAFGFRDATGLSGFEQSLHFPPDWPHIGGKAGMGQRAVAHPMSPIVLASSFVPTTVGLALFPQLAAHSLSRENRRTLVRGAGLLFVLGLLGVGVMFLSAAPLTAALYGSLAEAITPLLRLLALSFPLTFLCLFLSSSLQALHQETNALAALAIGTGIGFLATCALIPLFGADGAAYARVFSALIQLGLLTPYLWHLFSQSAPSPRDSSRAEAHFPHRAHV